LFLFGAEGCEFFMRDVISDFRSTNVCGF